MYISQGARFIACNDDAFDMVSGRKMPGAGAMVRSLQYSLDSHRGGRDATTPEIIGKPNPYVIELIQREHDITDKSRY